MVSTYRSENQWLGTQLQGVSKNIRFWDGLLGFLNAPSFSMPIMNVPNKATRAHLNISHIKCL